MARRKSLSADINFLFEMGSVRFINRTWKRFLNNEVANLAEHHFRLFWIAMTIAAHEKGADAGKVAKLAMVHDIAESRTGDVDYLSRQYVIRNEKLAIHDMLNGTALEKEFLGLWQEYETRKTLESKIVKDADNLDIDFELAEQAISGSPLKDKWQGTRKFVAEERLFTATARKIYTQLAAADPHDWHNNGRNRRNSGDWQK